MAAKSTREVPLRSIFSSVSERYQFQVCNTPMLKKRSFELRYKVYSEEKAWEPLNRQKSEKDKYEDHSVHIIVTERNTGIDVATTRLIIGKDLPLLKLDVLSDDHIFNPCKQILGTTAEVSRFSILNNHRGRIIAMAMFHYAGFHAYLRGCSAIYAVMEPSLAAKSRMGGVTFTQVSPPFFHHGTRAAYVISALDIIAQSAIQSDFSHTQLVKLYEILEGAPLDEVQIDELAMVG